MEEIEKIRDGVIENIANLEALINKSPLFHSAPKEWKDRVDSLTTHTRK